MAIKKSDAEVLREKHVAKEVREIEKVIDKEIKKQKAEGRSVVRVSLKDTLYTELREAVSKRYTDKGWQVTFETSTIGGWHTIVNLV